MDAVLAAVVVVTVTVGLDAVVVVVPAFAKTAVSVVAWFRVTTQIDDEGAGQPPVQLPNTDPESGVAVRTTCWLCARSVCR